MKHTRPKIDLPLLLSRNLHVEVREQGIVEAGGGGGGAPPSNTPFETAGTRTLESDRALNAPLAARAVAWRARALLLGGYPLPSPLCVHEDRLKESERERERESK